VDKFIIVADIDLIEDVTEDKFSQISKELTTRVMEEIQNVAYCSFYITPKFAY
jgi:hypothetical protein